MAINVNASMQWRCGPAAGLYAVAISAECMQQAFGNRPSLPPSLGSRRSDCQFQLLIDEEPPPTISACALAYTYSIY
jgi:hypothetical protein